MAWSYKDFTYKDFKDSDPFVYQQYKTPEELEKFEFEEFDKGEDFTYDKFTHKDYAESDEVKQAQSALNQHLANKPGEYQSQWQAQLDALMGSIMNRDKFTYDVNGDALYQQYKDKYVQQGKLAMGDAIGQASAMTGGYGNSYAQSVGQQQYQASLDNLNDIVPELYAMALDKYNREGQELYNQYGMLADRENQDYGRYRDTVSDFLTERDYLTGRYDSERDYDYSKYADERNFAYGQYSDDRNLDYQKYINDLNFRYGQYSDDRNLAYSQFESDKALDYQKYWDNLDFAYQQWADDRTFDYNKYAADRNLAYDKYATDKSLSYEDYRAAIADAQWAQKLAEEQRQFNEQMALDKEKFTEAQKQYAEQMALSKQQYEDSKAAANSGDNGGGNNTGGATFADTLWNATGTYDDNGNPVFRNSEGKTQAFGAGVNPYTGTKHADAKHGTFSNGYQPNNIGGTKLKNSGMSTNITGKEQTIWQANGKYWLWRGDLNKYIEVDVSDLD